MKNGQSDIREINERYRISMGQVRNINNGLCWQEILKDYKFSIRKLKIGLGNSVIDEEIAKNIVDKLINTEMNQVEIANLFRIDKQIVYCINRGTSWKHIFDENQNFPIRKTRIDNDKIVLIAKDLKANISVSDIAKKYNISRSTVNGINNVTLRRDCLDKFNFPIKSSIKIENEKIICIAYDILNTNLSLSDISKKYKVSITTVSNINKGKQNRSLLEEKFNFPIREFIDVDTQNEKILKIAKKLKTTIQPSPNIAKEFNVSTSLVSSINIGKYHKDILNDYSFPIRKNSVKEVITEDTARKIINLIIESSLSFVEIAKKFDMKAGVLHNIDQGITNTKLLPKGYNYPLRSNKVNE